MEKVWTGAKGLEKSRQFVSVATKVKFFIENRWSNMTFLYEISCGRESGRFLIECYSKVTSISSVFVLRWGNCISFLIKKAIFQGHRRKYCVEFWGNRKAINRKTPLIHRINESVMYFLSVVVDLIAHKYGLWNRRLYKLRRIAPSSSHLRRKIVKRIFHQGKEKYFRDEKWKFVVDVWKTARKTGGRLSTFFSQFQFPRKHFATCRKNSTQSDLGFVCFPATKCFQSFQMW